MTTIRAILGRFSAPFSRNALERVLQEFPIEFCADIYGGDAYEPLAGIPADQQDYFQSSEIRNGLYAGVDWNTIAPLDEEIIGSMRHCEAIFMTVVSRLESKKAIPHLTRKLWYLRHLQFWNDYITRNRINLYLSAWIPHEIPDIVIYYLCKAKNIPVLYYDITVFPDTSVPGNDVHHAAFRIEERYKELLRTHGDADPSSISLREPFASYEKALISKEGKPPALEGVHLPTYWDHLHRLLIKKPLGFLTHAVEYCTPAGWVRAFWAARRSWVMRASQNFYDSHVTEPDLTKRFVYFPLHFQPEAATVPMGGAYADQVLVARMLNTLLPDDVLIYVKEHPHQSNWANRSIAYYKDFLELSKVRFVPTRFNSFTLREHCSAVTTITGSAGFEAIFRGKPVFLFGSCYYQYAKGVFPIRSIDDGRSAVDAVFTKGEKPTPKTTHLFLKAMEETTAPGILDPWYLTITKKPEEHHTRVMGEAMVKELKTMTSAIERVSR